VGVKIIENFCAEALISSAEKNLLTGQEILVHFQNNFFARKVVIVNFARFLYSR